MADLTDYIPKPSTSVERTWDAIHRLFIATLRGDQPDLVVTDGVLLISPREGYNYHQGALYAVNAAGANHARNTAKALQVLEEAGVIELVGEKPQEKADRWSSSKLTTLPKETGIRIVAADLAVGTDDAIADARARVESERKALADAIQTRNKAHSMFVAALRAVKTSVPEIEFVEPDYPMSNLVEIAYRALQDRKHAVKRAESHEIYVEKAEATLAKLEG